MEIRQMSNMDRQTPTLVDIEQHMTGKWVEEQLGRLELLVREHGGDDEMLAVIEFLRDENTTNTAGQVLYDQWELLGKSEPVEMDFQEITLDQPCPADLAPPFGSLNIFDIQAYIGLYNAQDPAADLAADLAADSSSIVIFPFA